MIVPNDYGDLDVPVNDPSYAPHNTIEPYEPDDVDDDYDPTWDEFDTWTDDEADTSDFDDRDEDE